MLRTERKYKFIFMFPETYSDDQGFKIEQKKSYLELYS